MKTKHNRKRSAKRQRIHDPVIDALAETYRRRGHVAHANPSQQKNFAVANMYPDVVVLTKSDQRPLLIVEVETEESVRASEAARQWVEYDQRYRAWVLAVPLDARALANVLIEEHELRHVRLVTWAIAFAGLRW
jgi:hypothetical protein